MFLILDNAELPNIRKILIAMVMSRFFESRPLFLSPRDFREWAWEVVDEAIAVALQAKDWDPSRQRDATSEALKGLKVWFIFMKTWPIADKDLRQTRRYRKAVENAMARERSPAYDVKTPFELAIEQHDMEQALQFLSPDQAMAVSLVHFVKLSIGEAAQIMKRSRGALDMLLMRGRKRLCEILDDSTLFDDYVEPEPPARLRPGRPRTGRESKPKDVVYDQTRPPIRLYDTAPPPFGSDDDDYGYKRRSV